MGYATIGKDRVCHPDEWYLPDCYRRVVVYHERLGALKETETHPGGVTGIIDDEWRAWTEMVQLGQLLAATSGVCLSHLRYIPCERHEDTTACVFSTRPEDIARVMAAMDTD